MRHRDFGWLLLDWLLSRPFARAVEALLLAELPRMLAEHALIVAALKGLMQAAQEEGHQGYARYAQKMILHAQTEEEILYPASILVGEVLRARFGRT